MRHETDRHPLETMVSSDGVRKMNSHASPEEIEEWRGEMREESERVRQLRQAASWSRAGSATTRLVAVGGRRILIEVGG